MWRISADEQATVCKAELDVTLQKAFKLTKNAVTPSDLLMYRLNEVLRAAKDSNFGDAFTKTLEVLYLSIGRMQPDMTSKDHPILYIARNFAVVIEEAVRQRNEATATVSQSSNEEKAAQCRQTTNTVSPPPPYTRAEGSWSGETSAEDELLQGKKTMGGKEAGEKSSCGVFAAFARRTEVAAASKKEEGKAVEKCTATAAMPTLARPSAAPPAAAAAVVATNPADSTYQARLRRQFPNKILNFSPEAIEGRLSIHHLPITVKQADVRKLLEPFGRIIELNLGEQAKRVYALAKLESNAAANKAVESLHKKFYNGQASFPIQVQRLEYISSNRALPPRGPMPKNQLQQAKAKQQPSLPLPSQNKPAAVVKEGAPKQQQQEKKQGPAVVVTEVVQQLHQQQQEQQPMQQQPSLSRGWNRAMIRDEATKQPQQLQWTAVAVPAVVQQVVPEVQQQQKQQEQQPMQQQPPISRGWNKMMVKLEETKQQRSLPLSCGAAEEVKDEGSKDGQEDMVQAEQQLIPLESSKTEVNDQESEIKDEEPEISDEESEITDEESAITDEESEITDDEPDIEDQVSSEADEATQQVLSHIMHAKQAKYGDVEQIRDHVADDALEAPEVDEELSDNVSENSFYTIVSSGVD